MNTAKGIPYIGSSKDISRRWDQHRRRLKKGNHCNPKLQAAWNKYGESVFACEPIEFIPEHELQERETYWIQVTWPFNYNISRRGDRIEVPVRRGWKHKLETRTKISLAHLGKKHRPYTEEEKLAQSLRLRGRAVTWGQKISDSKKGKDFLSPEAHKRQAESLSKVIKGKNNPNFGHRWTEEQRQKMSKTLETLKYNFVCDRCNRVFTAVTRSSYGGHRRKCLLYTST
jgi:group I intron endonuclease